MKALRELNGQLERQLRLQSYPLAIRLLESEGEIPPTALRPLRDLGHHLSTCQAFAISRREGLMVAELKEDMWCPEPAIGYGLEPPPSFFLEGHNRYPRDVATLEAGATWASREFPRLEPGRYMGVLSAPLASASYMPHVVVIYCNTAQLTILLLGIAYRDGLDVEARLSGHAACVYSVVPTMKTGRCWVSLPCMGDRARAMAGDDEIIFTLPPEDAGDLLRGLRHIEKTRRIPFRRSMQPEYDLLEDYEKMAKMLGIIGEGEDRSS
ncbi:MAG: hypothetical protein AYL28_004490 [Candidatus Bathyarchaeota archaeon B23]|nr:MAG: hypothetical protein AYL28_004490 [Candidatus Bathyarchaeota archaeon B23]